MKLFFWQNINSIHQSTFFKSLVTLEGVQVTLIVTEKISDFRLEMGWNLPEIKGLLIIDLSEKQISWHNLIDLNSSSDSLHIFSGINAFPKVHNAFLYALKKKCRVGVFTEPLDFRGIKGVLRNLRGYYYSLKFKNKITLILVTGKFGYKQFKNWGYGDNKIFEWSYTVEQSSNLINSSDKLINPVFRIMFAGSLIHRKGYDILINALKIIKNKNFKFHADLFCLQENENEKGQKIVKEANLEKEINLLHFLPNKELRIQMNFYDLFILPSRHDGWGAVINESLSEGTPVIVSSKCGSSTLITSFLTGSKINILNEYELSKIIYSHIRKGKLNNEDRLKLRNWYESHVSGSKMTEYFMEIVAFIDNTKNVSKPTVPWEQ